MRTSRRRRRATSKNRARYCAWADQTCIVGGKSPVPHGMAIPDARHSGRRTSPLLGRTGPRRQTHSPIFARRPTIPPRPCTVRGHRAAPHRRRAQAPHTCLPSLPRCAPHGTGRIRHLLFPNRRSLPYVNGNLLYCSIVKKFLQKISGVEAIPRVDSRDKFNIFRIAPTIRLQRLFDDTMACTGMASPTIPPSPAPPFGIRGMAMPRSMRLRLLPQQAAPLLGRCASCSAYHPSAACPAATRSSGGGR